MVSLLLSLKVLLESDHYFFTASSPKIRSVLPDNIAKRRISISLRNWLRLTISEKPSVTWFKSSEILLFYILFTSNAYPSKPTIDGVGSAKYYRLKVLVTMLDDR